MQRSPMLVDSLPGSQEPFPMTRCLQVSLTERVVVAHHLKKMAENGWMEKGMTWEHVRLSTVGFNMSSLFALATWAIFFTLQPLQQLSQDLRAYQLGLLKGCKAEVSFIQRRNCSDISSTGHSFRLLHLLSSVTLLFLAKQTVPSPRHVSCLEHLMDEARKEKERKKCFMENKTFVRKTRE